MDKKPYNKRRRLYKRLMVILAIIVVLIVGTFMFLARNMKPVLTQKLKDQVIASSDSLYHITFNNLHLNLYTGSIELADFRLIPDTAVYTKLKLLNIAPENIFDVSVQRLEFRHAHPFRLFFKKEVQIKEIRINQPIVKIYHEDLVHTDTTQSLEVIMRNLISGPLKSIHIARIGLNNISLSYKNNSDTTDKGFSLRNADIVFKQFAIDQETIHDTTRYFYSKDMWFHLTDFKMPTKSSLYDFYLQDFAYSMEQQTALIKGFSVKSNLSDAAFDKAVGIQTDKIDFTVDTIQLTGLHAVNILYKRRLGEIKSLELSGAKLDVYRNRALPEKKSLKPLPQEMLRDAAKGYLMKTISTQFTLDTVNIHHLDVTYREHNPKSTKTGEVSFDDLHGAFYNVTNDSMQLLKNNHCVADLQAKFMNRGNVKVHFDFNLTDSTDIFSYSGSLSTMKATALNRATRNLGMVSIKSGEIKKLDLDFNADNNQANGTVHLLYDDLSIKLLTLDEQSGQLKNKGVATLLANVLVLQNNNIEGENPTQSATVHYTRDKYKSMFNLMWKSVFEGVKEVLGMDQKPKGNSSGTNKQKPESKENLLDKIKGVFKKK